MPLASGLLSGKFKPDQEFADNDHRNYNCDGQAFNVGETFAGVPFATGLEFVAAIEVITSSELHGATLAQKTLRWILDQPAITTVIPGARNAEQAGQNAEVSRLPALSASVHEKLSDLYRERIDAAIRGVY